MKLKPVPTSPKNKKTKKEIENLYKEKNLTEFHQPKRKWRSSLFIGLILASLFGLLGGIIGEVVLNSYLFSQPTFLDRFYFLDNDKNVTIQSNQSSNQTTNWPEVVSQAGGGLVKIFDQNSQNDEGYFIADDVLGNGVILSSDGLAVTTTDTIVDQEADLVAVTPDRKTYRITNYYSDSISPLLFFKIETSGLAVMELAGRNDIALGQDLIALENYVDSSQKTISTLSVSKLHSGNNEQSLAGSEDYNDYLEIFPALPVNSPALPVLDERGRLIGISDPNQSPSNLLITSDIIQSALESILSQSTITRNYLGVNYLELEKIIDVEGDIAYGLKKGALIRGDELTGKVAVEEDSPAAEAGLEWGDIIISIGTNEINESNLLSSLIQDYQPDKPLEFLVLREGKEKKIPVTLELLAQ